MNKLHNKFTNKLTPENAYYRMQVKLANIAEGQFPFDLAIKTFVEAEISRSKIRSALGEVLRKIQLENT